VRKYSHEFVIPAVFRAKLLTTQPEWPEAKVIGEFTDTVLGHFKRSNVVSGVDRVRREREAVNFPNARVSGASGCGLVVHK
jgi:hypothetical protein